MMHAVEGNHQNFRIKLANSHEKLKHLTVPGEFPRQEDKCQSYLTIDTTPFMAGQAKCPFYTSTHSRK